MKVFQGTTKISATAQGMFYISGILMDNQTQRRMQRHNWDT